MGYQPGLQPVSGYFAVKMPVFSFEKIQGADIALGPEMKSTGECLGVAKEMNEAMGKAFAGAGISLPKSRKMVITVRDRSQEEMVPVAKKFAALGYQIYATAGTCRTFRKHGVLCEEIRKAEAASPNILDLVMEHDLDLIIDIPETGIHASRDGFRIRRLAVETGVYVISAVDTARALSDALSYPVGFQDPVDTGIIQNRSQRSI